MGLVDVKKIGGLNKQQSPDLISPENAVESEYWDIFRADAGKIAPAFNFKSDPPVNLPDDWEDDTSHPGRIYNHVICSFMLGDCQMIITATKNLISADWLNILTDLKLWYIKKVWDGSLQEWVNKIFQIVLFPEDAPLCAPRRVLIDPTVYKWTEPFAPQNTLSFYNAYIFGTAIDDYGNHVNKPIRIILSQYRYGIDSNDCFSIRHAAFFPENVDPPADALSWDIREYGDNATFVDDYSYQIFLEDVAGNFIFWGPPMEKIWEGPDRTYLKHEFHFGSYDTVGYIRRYGLKRLHIYRTNKTAADTEEPDNEDYHWDKAAWLTTIELGWGTSYYRWNDTDASDDNLGDLMSEIFTREEKTNWMRNIEKSNECVGFHMGAMWCSLGSDVIFSKYTVDAPFGTRILNFPSVNHWRFDDIGDVADLKNLGSTLIVFGTKGISTLNGLSWSDFSEQKIASIGIRWPSVLDGEWEQSATTIDDKIVFIDVDGNVWMIIASEFEHHIKKIVRIPEIVVGRTGSVITKETEPHKGLNVFDPIDVCRFRHGFMITNGSTIYLLDVKNGRWTEWPRAVRRFVIGLDPYLAEKYITKSGEDVSIVDYNFFKYVDDNGLPALYGTAGDEDNNSVWKTPRLRFNGEQKITMLILHWEYQPNYPYGGQEIETWLEEQADKTMVETELSRTSETGAGNIQVFLDDRLTAVKTIKFTLTPTSQGSYKKVVLINCRGERMSFKLTLNQGKYFHLTGWQLKFEDRGRRTFE